MFISNNHARIFTTSFGLRTNPVIVGIGGWIGSWELWSEPFSILSQAWFTIAYDHRGSGTTVAAVETITFDNLVDDVFAVLDAYDVGRCVLAAESAGALTALGAALKNPDRIAGLVIVDGMYFQESSAADPFLYGLRNDYQATINSFIEACVPEKDSEETKHWGRQILSRASQQSAIALYLSFGDVDLRSDLKRIAQPTLILHGEMDNLVSVKEAQWLSNALPQATLSLIEGAGHVPTMTHPNRVADEVTAFFGQV